MTVTTEVKLPRKLHGAGIVTSTPFVPATGWAELEARRERHERALAEIREARRAEAMLKDRHQAQRALVVDAAAGRVLSGEPAEDPAAGEDARRREVDAIGVRLRAARQAAKQAVHEALQLVAEHDEWAAEIAERRAAALAEHEELLARAEAARVLAHAEDHLEKWLVEAASSSVPQPYREAGPPPGPPETIRDVFGAAA